uniref:Uncharacterized protein n=1 Tax=Anguilla anguilla TaxID=7936 RepID=A0A0E9VGB0_ANGAN
MFLYSLEE